MQKYKSIQFLIEHTLTDYFILFATFPFYFTICKCIKELLYPQIKILKSMNRQVVQKVIFVFNKNVVKILTGIFL